MPFQRFTALNVSEVLTELDTEIVNGLDHSSILSRRDKFGKNELVNNELVWWKIFFRQFKSAFIYILVIASAVTFLFGEHIDSLFILFFVVTNVLLGFFQEYKSEKTVKLLQKYTNKRATVIRDAREQNIDATELVPGDIVLIETGDIIPADLRLIEVNGLMVDESTLTGESIQIRKNTDALLNEEKEPFKCTNIAFSGTTVVEGKAYGVVISTGKNTQFGKISKLATEVVDTSAFEKQINKFSKFILFQILITLVIVFIVHVVFKDTLTILQLVMFSIALAVGVIPEAMPLVTTFSLSLGAAKLAKKKVIVKRLSAIEDLGSIQILCTDKTGTITENKLSVSDVYSHDREITIKYALLAASSLSETGTPNNSFDLAIINSIGPEYKKIVSSARRIYEIPFNPNRRRNSVLINENEEKKIIVRGALESILPHVDNIKDTEKEDISQWAVEEGKKGRRIIAIASKKHNKDLYEIHNEEQDIEFIGLISFEDPIKSSTKEAIKKANTLGVTTKVITGDSSDVAVAVGLEIGLASDLNQVITGEEFSKFPKSKQKEIAHKINIFARMSPEQKYDLIKLLQEDYNVGFLGEGINDAPALKVAGVSIVVDNASDVAREVADIILLKSDLQVIVNGIELGRQTFVNVANYIKATMASNFGNFYAMVFVTLVIDYLPMLPVQILLVNLLSDFPMISIATDNVDRKDIIDPKSYAMKELILVATVLGLVSTGFDFMTFGIFKSFGESSLQTYWFICSILTELVLIYSIRTKGWFFKVKNAPSKAIILLTGVAMLATIFIPFTDFGVTIFRFIVPAWDKLLIVMGIVVAYLISTEVVKKLYYKYLNFSK